MKAWDPSRLIYSLQRANEWTEFMILEVCLIHSLLPFLQGLPICLSDAPSPWFPFWLCFWPFWLADVTV